MELADTYTAKAINAAIKKNSISTKPISVAKKGRCIRINKDSVTLIYRDRKNGDTTLTLGEWGGVYGITCKQAEKEITNRLGEKKEQKKKEKLEANSFEGVAKRWLKYKQREWSDGHYLNQTKKLINHVYPLIGSVDVRDLTKYHVLEVLEELDRKGMLESRDRIHQIILRILDGAVFDEKHPKHPTGLEFNVAAFVRSSTPRLTKREGDYEPTTYRAMRLERVPEFLAEMNSGNADPIVKLLVAFQILTMTRPSEARQALWQQIDWKGRVWRIPGGTRRQLGNIGNHMKKNREHWVPLSDQAVMVLNQLWEITGKGKVLFPRINPYSYYGGNKNLNGQQLDPERFDHTSHLSYNAVGFAIHDLGGEKGNWKYDEHPHGFRKTASTYLHGLKDTNGHQEFASEWVEYQLAHKDTNKVRDTYIDKTPDLYLDSRREMIQVWGDRVMPKKLSVVKVA